MDDLPAGDKDEDNHQGETAANDAKLRKRHVQGNAAIKSNAAGNYLSVPIVVVAGATSGSSEDGVTVKQQTVTIGLSDDSNTEVTVGLNEGDTLADF